MFNEQEIKKMIQSTLTLTDTFKFSCKVCGNCCRNRKEPIILAGYDVFKIAKAMKIEMSEVLNKYTIGYIGKTSNLPIHILKERQDGSCSLLRNGKCIVHNNKPIVCAIYPLGRYFIPTEGKFGYFQQPIYCGDKIEHTLEEWLNAFNIHEWDEASSLWASTVTKLAEQTMKIKSCEEIQKVARQIEAALYIDYNISQPYAEQLIQNTVNLMKK